jgi:hypothetical protein
LANEPRKIPAHPLLTSIPASQAAVRQNPPERYGQVNAYLERDYLPEHNGRFARVAAKQTKTKKQERGHFYRGKAGDISIEL